MRRDWDRHIDQGVHKWGPSKKIACEPESRSETPIETLTSDYLSQDHWEKSIPGSAPWTNETTPFLTVPLFMNFCLFYLLIYYFTFCFGLYSDVLRDHSRGSIRGAINLTQFVSTGQGKCLNSCTICPILPWAFFVLASTSLTSHLLPEAS